MTNQKSFLLINQIAYGIDFSNFSLIINEDKQSSRNEFSFSLSLIWTMDRDLGKMWAMLVTGIPKSLHMSAGVHWI